jgi:hypothetical protein
LCDLVLTNRNWIYKRFVANKEQDVVVPDKAQIFEIPDPLDQLTFLVESIQIGLNGAIAYYVDKKVLEAIKTNPICR